MKDLPVGIVCDALSYCNACDYFRRDYYSYGPSTTFVRISESDDLCGLLLRAVHLFGAVDDYQRSLLREARIRVRKPSTHEFTLHGGDTCCLEEIKDTEEKPMNQVKSLLFVYDNGREWEAKRVTETNAQGIGNLGEARYAICTYTAEGTGLRTEEKFSIPMYDVAAIIITLHTGDVLVRKFKKNLQVSLDIALNSTKLHKMKPGINSENTKRKASSQERNPRNRKLVRDYIR